jgi:hypothetical protein
VRQDALLGWHIAEEVLQIVGGLGKGGDPGGNDELPKSRVRELCWIVYAGHPCPRRGNGSTCRGIGETPSVSHPLL